jgi:very-short-patch-repair endonuclease
MPDLYGPFVGSHAVSEGWLTATHLRSPLLWRVFRGVYLPKGIPFTHELRCIAASLIAPPEAVVTGCSAAAIHGIELGAAEDPVEFLIPERTRFVAQRGLDIRRTKIVAGEFEPWRSISIASPLRAVLDILFNTRLRKSLPRTVGLLDALLRAGFIDREELRVVLEARHDHGIVRARKALELADPLAESIPESELRVWLWLSGFRPVVQFEVRHGVYRLDLAFPEFMIAVEYDGEWHAEGNQPELDARRRAQLEAAGWHFVIVTKDMLYGDPRAVVDLVRQALRQRGWRK